MVAGLVAQASIDLAFGQVGVTLQLIQTCNGAETDTTPSTRLAWKDPTKRVEGAVIVLAIVFKGSHEATDEPTLCAPIGAGEDDHSVDPTMDRKIIQMTIDCILDRFLGNQWVTPLIKGAIEK